MILCLNIAGILLIVLGLVHIVFPRHFHWRQELRFLSLINRQIMYIHTFFIALTVVLLGTLCLSSAADLLSGPLGKKICLGLALFSGLRLGIQFFGYSPALWKGKTRETLIHLLFALTWAYLGAVFLAAAIACSP